MSFIFKPAEKEKTSVKMALVGPANSGKTMGALLMAKGFGGKIAVIDTENNSSTLYSKLEWCPKFDVLDLKAPYSPERFIEAITAAENFGYDTIIIDSATHEWNGVGGCLEINDLAAAKLKGNSWSAWNETTARHRAFINKILQSPCNIVVTLRSKTETAQQEINGKKKVVKLGMKAEQRDGIEYEFSIVLELTQDNHLAFPTKDRSEIFKNMGDFLITEQTGVQVKEWFDDGIDAHKKYVESIYSSKSLDELRDIWLSIPKNYREKLEDDKNHKKMLLSNLETNVE